MKIKIDPEFSRLIPAAEHDSELEAAILADGKFFNPSIVWSHQHILLDGHRRERLKVKHPQLKSPPPIVMDFEDRQSAHDWIIDHQLSKRNITDVQRKYLLGKRYNQAKKDHGGIRPEQVSKVKLDDLPKKTAESIADEKKLSPSAVVRAGQFAETLDAVDEQIKAVILAGDLKATTKDLKELAELPANTAKTVAREIKSGEVKSVREAIDAVVVPEPAPKTRAAKPAKDDEGGWEPGEAVKHLQKMEKAFGQAARAYGDARKILGDSAGLKTVYGHLDEACKALARFKLHLKRRSA